MPAAGLTPAHQQPPGGPGLRERLPQVVNPLLTNSLQRGPGLRSFSSLMRLRHTPTANLFAVIILSNTTIIDNCDVFL